MLSSTGSESSDQNNYNSTSNNRSSTNSNNTLKRLPSSFWSSSPSPSRFSHPFPFQTPQTMEEVWKDINLASLSEPTPNNRSSSLLHMNLPHEPHHRHHPNFRNMTLQDFLARPFGHNNESPARLISAATSDTTLMNNSSPSPLPPPQAPPTPLSLNHSGSDQFQLFYVSDPLIRPPNSGLILDNHHHLPHSANPNKFSSSVSNSFSGSPFESLPDSSSGFPSFGKRSFPESDHSNSGDRRHKRMIKNRESAARSRARKQAYTNELELEVANLMEENARLKKQQEQLCYPTSSQQHRTHNLHRSSTAPF